MVATASSTFPFFQLPREIRDQIYKNVFDTAPYHWLTAQTHPDKLVYIPDSSLHSASPLKPFAHAFPAICRVSRQLYLEAAPMFLRATYCLIHSENGGTAAQLVEWLDQFPNNEGFSAVHYIHLADFPADGAAKHNELIQRCVNLGYMELNFAMDGFIDQFEDGSATFPPDEFIAQHQLEKILDHPKLEAFTLSFENRLVRCIYQHRLLLPLKNWFESEGRKRGKKMEVYTGYEQEFAEQEAENVRSE